MLSLFAANFLRMGQKWPKGGGEGGKENIWCTTGNGTFLLDKIKQHKDNDVHQQAEEIELKISSRTQPSWTETQAKQISKQEQAVQNLMLASIYICRQYQSLNSLEELCILLEKLGVQLLPSVISGVNYRNNDAAFSFLQHVAFYLHKELVEKVKASTVIAWMMDESTSRTVEKSCIVYVRYLENNQPKTSFYSLLDMEGDGTAENIVKTISSLWQTDDLDPANTCWFASDNASTFTGIHEGVVAKLRRRFRIDWLESNTCAAHSFNLVGNGASWTIDPNTGKSVIVEIVSNLETTIGKIYNYFGRSSNRQQKLKDWQNFLDMPELKFKRIYDIRCSSIQGCIKPIIQNVQPNNQALLATLEQNACGPICSQADRDATKELFQCVLDDEFLFLLHFHHDLHECALGPITKLMQFDKVSYYCLMKEIDEKKCLISQWISQSTPTWGPTLADYIKTTRNGTYGAFKINLCNRQKLTQECLAHIQRLLEELDKRFAPSPILECMTLLFDPRYLIEHKKDIDCPTYGRQELDFIRNKYKDLLGFDFYAVQNEWELLKRSLSHFLGRSSATDLQETFWQQFLLLQQSINSQFLSENKNILFLLNIYLISPTNSAECERGFSVANRIQTTGRSRIMISTLNVLMNICLLLPDDLRSARCQQVMEKGFESWNDNKSNRRFRQMKLVLDIPSDYEPKKLTRPNCSKRKRLSISSQSINKKPKNPKSKAIRCANGCKTEIAANDPTQYNAIQCCHQRDEFDWVDAFENCSRWLCNRCRIKLGISTDSMWFCTDHDDMHSEEECEDEDVSN
ncbi:unnamed protein product [Rotaria sp. Silwood2]|nr:unnamed protein product [Rotaria sp. Silwood2]